MKVLFRVDSSILIGTGHVMRCLTLADELRAAGHRCLFICASLDGHISGVIERRGYKVSMLPRSNNVSTPEELNGDYARWLGESWQQDARQTFEVISRDKPTWLVVDHYALDEKWERFLSVAVNKIMVIDDLANRHHECSLLLDQNLGRAAKDYDGLLPAECLRLIGPSHALLRPEFAALREQSLSCRKRPDIKRILISLGGVDRTNVTGQVLTALVHSELPASTELDIIMGSSAPYLNEVRQQSALLPFKATVSVNVQDMAERMYLADISIGAAGGTSWERACLGLPAVLVVLAENQVSGAKALETAGAARIIGEPSLIGTMLPSIFAELSNSVQLTNMSKAAANITDGDGVFRVVSIMGTMEG